MTERTTEQKPVWDRRHRWHPNRQVLLDYRAVLLSGSMALSRRSTAGRCPPAGPFADVVSLVRGLRNPGESPEAAQVLDSVVEQVPELGELWTAAQKPTKHGVSVIELALLRHCLLTDGVDRATSAHGVEALSRLLRHVPATAGLACRLDEDAPGDVDRAVELALELAAEDAAEASTTEVAA